MNCEEKIIEMLDNDEILLFNVYYYADFQFMPYEERPILMENFDYEFSDYGLLETIDKLAQDFDSSDDYFIDGIYGISSISNIENYIIENADYIGQINLIIDYYADESTISFCDDKMRKFVRLCQKAFYEK